MLSLLLGLSPVRKLIGGGITLLVIGAAFGIVYLKGRSDANHRWELRQAEAQAQAQEAARQAEVEANRQIETVRANYEDRIHDIGVKYSSVVSDYGRLRLRLNKRVPQSAPAPARPDERRTPGPGDGQEFINLGIIAESIVSLGRDLDGCRAKVMGLQEYARTCREMVK